MRKNKMLLMTDMIKTVTISALSITEKQFFWSPMVLSQRIELFFVDYLGLLNG